MCFFFYGKKKRQYQQKEFIDHMAVFICVVQGAPMNLNGPVNKLVLKIKSTGIHAEPTRNFTYIPADAILHRIAG